MTLIMDTALEHFAGEGYHSTTINHIAKHAGISKGLMYNYFSSKEELLKAILKRSVAEVYDSFDLNRDGILSDDEFEYFIRHIARILREKKNIWRLFFQLLMQGDVREQLLRSFNGSNSFLSYGGSQPDEDLMQGIMKTITDYFLKKKERKGPGYDPLLDLNMFIITLKGFSLTCVYQEDTDGEIFDKTVNAIIENFK